MATSEKSVTATGATKTRKKSSVKKATNKKVSKKVKASSKKAEEPEVVKDTTEKTDVKKLQLIEESIDGEMALKPAQVEKLLRLSQEIQCANKELELYHKSLEHFDKEMSELTHKNDLETLAGQKDAEALSVKAKHMVEVLQYKRALVVKEKELIAMKKKIELTTNKSAQTKADNAKSAYKEYSKELSKELGVDFTKCAFDPLTGIVTQV